MNWPALFGIGLLNAIIGVFGVGTLAALWIEWHRIPGGEGGSAYHVMLIGVLGGVIYFLGGMAGARAVAAGEASGFVRGLSVVVGSGVGLLLIAAFVGWSTADHDTTLHGRPVQLHAEIKCPPGFTIPPDATDAHWYAQLDTRSRRATSRAALRLDETKLEAGHLVIPVTLDLLTSVEKKLLHVRLGENTQLFTAVFPAKPGRQYFSWSEWLDGVSETNQSDPARAQRFTLRFRVQVVPPPETPEQADARILTERTIALAALTPDSAIEDLLKFTHYSQGEEQRQAAGALIARRLDVVKEMTEQILSPDRAQADRALRALAYIKPQPAGVAPPVAAVGERVIAAIAQFNATKPEDDPADQSGAEVAALFSGWIEAHQALHELGGIDGVPMLERILELSLQRTDDRAARTDVARVAQFYVTKWKAQHGAERVAP